MSKVGVVKAALHRLGRCNHTWVLEISDCPEDLKRFRSLLGKYAKKAGMTLKTKRVGDDLRIWRVE